MSFNGMEEAGEEAVEAVQIRDKEWREESSPQVFPDSLTSRNFNKPSTTDLNAQFNNNDSGADMVNELTLNVNNNNSDDLNYAKEGLVFGGFIGGSVRDRPPGQWNHLYQLSGGLGHGSSHLHRENVLKDKEHEMVHAVGAGGGMGMGDCHNTILQSNQYSPDRGRRLGSSENGAESPSSGIQTKLLSSSGFSQFLVRNSLKGKGVVHRYYEPRDGIGGTGTGNTNEIEKAVVNVGKVASEAALDLNSMPKDEGAGPAVAVDGILLREWLKPGRKVNRDESLHLFKQIVELVDIAHSEQVVLHVRPSSFKLLPSNQVKYIGSFGESEKHESVRDLNVNCMAHQSSRKRLMNEGLSPSNGMRSKQQKINKNVSFVRQQSDLLFRSAYKGKRSTENDVNNAGSQDSGYDTSQQHSPSSGHRMQNRFGIPVVSNTTQNQCIAANFQLEDKWYTSPEEHNEKEHTFSSDIYSLGVLLFELFCCSESWEVHTVAMLDIRHRILPPNFLSEYPKEAGFCLWLLHPVPSSRPSTREIIHSALVCESKEVSEGQQSLPSRENHTESELLLHFLLSLKEVKQKRASKLVDDIGSIEADIKEVERRHLSRSNEVISWKDKNPSNTSEFLSKESASSQARLMKNINQLENAYFSMRSQIQFPDTDGTGRSDKDVLKSRESWSRAQNENEGSENSTDHLGVFFDGLCKYARYNKFELRGTLRNVDLLNSANVICSLSFDRDEEYFATAGISKKIKIFEFNSLLNDSVDIHYPVVEMPSKSKLSCVCWNNYIKNYLAATDYDGMVQLWDTSTGQGFSQYTDHEKRAWSVDFSPVDPTKFASGSDDCSVKLWNINERKCISTIQSFANVCCVQFSPESTHLLAFGSADYKTYCYDLRNTRIPWCTLAGHGKAVSYVKFLDSKTLVSTSTDNTLKLWDLNKSSCSGLSANACSLTFRGHTNEKNFVGLSVSDGYIACGSESNEVYAYYRSLPMPITSHKFGSIDPISGQESADESGQFVSSVCWKGKSDMVIAANSSGSIKLLQMV